MSIKYVNGCVSCPPNMGCMGSTCPYRQIPVRYCDACGEEINEEQHIIEGYNDLCDSCYDKLVGGEIDDE